MQLLSQGFQLSGVAIWLQTGKTKKTMLLTSGKQAVTTN